MIFDIVTNIHTFIIGYKKKKEKAILQIAPSGIYSAFSC